MARSRAPSDFTSDLIFPIEGVSDERAYVRQRQGTCVDAVNVTAFEPATGRARGGSRSGMDFYMPDAIVTENVPVQCIHQLISTTNPPDSLLNGFVFSKGAGFGLGIGNVETGASVYSLGVTSGYEFACSCWGDESDLYAGQVNTTTGAMKIQKFNYDGTTAWTQTGLTACLTGTLRALSGMVVVPPYLFIAYRTAAAPDTLGSTSCRIARLNISDGTIESATWRVSGSANGMYWSTASINCLGKMGTTIGAMTSGYGGANTQMLFYDASSPATSSAGLITAAALGGTQTHTRSKVVSDGSYFYAIATVQYGKVLKIGVSSSGIWYSGTGTETVNSLCYDAQTQKLVVVTDNSTTSMKVLNLSTGAISSTPSQLTGEAKNIDSDGEGNFVRWADSAATNDIEGLTSTLANAWGPSSFTNTVHGGVSINKGTIGNIPAVSSQRAIRLIAVSGGTAVRVTETEAVSLSGGTVLNAAAKQIFAAQLGLDLYFVDGLGFWKYVNSSDSVVDWEALVTAASSTIPRGTTGVAPRLIEPYRGRLILSGYVDDPHLYYMCKVDDPLDWEFISTATQDETGAVAGSTGLFNYPGEKINCVIPYTDDTVLYGDDHTIWMLSGDPAAGGRFDRVDSTLGMVFGRPWAVGRFNILFFMGSEGRLYKMTPGSLPTPISQAIDERLIEMDLADVCVSMAYDWHALALRIWCTSKTSAAKCKHFLYEERTNAFFPVAYENKRHNPFAVVTLDGDKEEDRGIMLGGQDGRLYILGQNYERDGLEPIKSSVILGPLIGRDLHRMKIQDIQTWLSDSSGEVKWEVFVGETAEATLAGPARASGKWVSGRNAVSGVMEAGHVAYVKLSSSNRWAIEKVIVRLQDLGFVMGRA